MSSKCECPEGTDSEGTSFAITTDQECNDDLYESNCCEESTSGVTAYLNKEQNDNGVVVYECKDGMIYKPIFNAI